MEKKLTVEEFNALPQHEKAVLVAQDIKEQIRINRITVEKGNYCRLNLRGGYSNDVSLQKPVKENPDELISCEVCALGAAMLSVTGFANKLTFGELRDFDTDKTALGLLNTVFTPHQMLLIETAFENYNEDEKTLEDFEEDIRENEGFQYNDESRRIGKDVFKAELSEEEVRACIQFYEYNGNDEERLIEICDNIIYNDGIFKP